MIGKNNPLNIRYNPLNHWKGLIGQTRGFCDFSDVSFGVRVAYYLLKVSYPKKGLTTYSSLIRRFAPPSENDTFKYTEFVCSNLGVFPFDEPVIIFDYVHMVYYMSIFEGNEISIEDCLRYYKMFFKD